MKMFLTVNYYRHQGSAVGRAKLEKAFVGGSFDEKKFDEAWDQAKSSKRFHCLFIRTKGWNADSGHSVSVTTR